MGLAGFKGRVVGSFWLGLGSTVHGFVGFVGLAGCIGPRRVLIRLTV